MSVPTQTKSKYSQLKQFDEAAKQDALWVKMANKEA